MKITEAMNQLQRCNKIDKEKDDSIKKVLNSIYASLNQEKIFEQTIQEEAIYELGLESSVRLFGFVKGNVFRTCFIDYYHSIFFDERRTTVGMKERKWSFA